MLRLECPVLVEGRTCPYLTQQLRFTRAHQLLEIHMEAQHGRARAYSQRWWQCPRILEDGVQCQYRTAELPYHQAMEMLNRHMDACQPRPNTDKMPFVRRASHHCQCRLQSLRNQNFTWWTYRALAVLIILSVGLGFGYYLRYSQTKGKY